MSGYEMMIGLEVHCELKTESKLLCACKNVFGGEPNTRICPVCTGYPGVLPSLNGKAVELTVAAGLALGCKIEGLCRWDRKNYFYPDLPKAWQTTQFGMPLVGSGMMEYEEGGEKHVLRINRIQLEEDAGKLLHDGDRTFVDFNRCGVPLIEIVTEPDLRSPGQAAAALTEIKKRLKFAGVSDVKMQEGSLRCDVNLSVAKKGDPPGVRTENKNLNSVKAVVRCCEYEAARQIKILSEGGSVRCETRKWDDFAGKGIAMRAKESFGDYKFIAEPDIPPVELSSGYVSSVAASLPPSASARRQKYTACYGLPEYDAEVLTCDCAVSDLFDDAVKCGADPKKASNIIMTGVLRLAKTEGREDYEIKIDGARIAEGLALVGRGVISLNSFIGSVLPALWGSTECAEDTVVRLELQQLSAEETVKIVEETVKENDSAVAEYLSGNKKVFSFLAGRAMKAGAGRCNPAVLNETLNKILNKKGD